MTENEKPDPIDRVLAGMTGELAETFIPPGPESVRHTVRRRRMARVAGLAVVVVLAAFSATIAFAQVRGSEDSITPAPAPTSQTPGVVVSPSDSPSSKPLPDIRAVNWSSAQVDFSGISGRFCPETVVQFTNESVTVGDRAIELWPDTIKPVFGDLDGEGATEAVLPVSCGPANSESFAHLAVVRSTVDGLVAVSVLELTDFPDGSPQYLMNPLELAVNGDTIVMKIEGFVYGDLSFPSTQERTYQLRGKTLQQIDGPTKFTNQPRTVDTVDWKNQSLTMPDAGIGCPAGKAQFSDGVSGQYRMVPTPAPYPQTVLYGHFISEDEAQALMVIQCGPATGIFVLAFDGDELVVRAVAWTSGRREGDNKPQWTLQSLTSDTSLEFTVGYRAYEGTEQCAGQVYQWKESAFVPQGNDCTG